MDDIDVLERFALSKDRDATVSKMTPGTREHYVFATINHMNKGELQAAEKLLVQWRRNLPHVEPEKLQQLEHRLAVLKFDRNPNDAIRHITEFIQPDFQHTPVTSGVPQAQQGSANAPSFPSTLDPKLIDTDALVETNLKRTDHTGFLHERGLRRFAGLKFNDQQRRDYLAKLMDPDVDNLVELISADLKASNTRFGHLTIHRFLCLDQLHELGRRNPSLLEDNTFVTTYLAKLQPSADVSIEQDVQAHETHLQQMLQFVEKLPNSFLTMKARVVFKLLELQSEQKDTYDLKLFLKYLQYPRSSPVILPALLSSSKGSQAVLHAHINGVESLLPPISDETKLLRSFLYHFATLRKPEPAATFTRLLRKEFVDKCYAEAKLLYAIEPSSDALATAVGGADALKQLHDEVRLDLVASNPVAYQPEDTVRLVVDVKNVPELHIRAFEINTFNYYKDKLQELPDDLNLDGLVPNVENNLSFAQPPMIMHRETIELPQLTKRGVFVIELIGNGYSSRAIVRKGRLVHSSSLIAAGHLVSIFDETGKQLKDASVWVEGQMYFPEEDGQVLIPFTRSDRQTKIVLCAGGFSCLSDFHHLAEQYSLKAVFHADPQQLVSGNPEAKVIIAPRLSVADQRISLELLQNAALTIEMRTHDGVSVTKVEENLELLDEEEFVYTFSVIENLSEVSFRLSGEVERTTGASKETVSWESSVLLNEALATDNIDDVFLQQGANKSLLVLGRTGEPKPARVVTVELENAYLAEPLRFKLQSDRNGRIQLGELRDVTRIQARCGDAAHTWTLVEQAPTTPYYVHALAGEEIRVPMPGTESALSWKQTLMQRDSSGPTGFVRNMRDRLRIDGGYIVISDLPPGDFRLSMFHELEPKTVEIRVKALSPRSKRFLEPSPPPAPTIMNVSFASGEVKIKVSNATPTTRVHVRAFEVTEDTDSLATNLSSLAQTRTPDVLASGVVACCYMSGRRLSDEYRYILDRRQSTTRAGNMMAHPSLLMNPFAFAAAKTDRFRGEKEQDFLTRSAMPASAAERRRRVMNDRQRRDAMQGPTSSYDWLASPSHILTNLRVDDNGELVISQAMLGKAKLVRAEIVLVDLDFVSGTSVDLTKQPSAPQSRDLTLQQAHVEDGIIEQREPVVVAEGSNWTLPGRSAASYRVFDSISKLFSALNTLSNGPAKQQLGSLSFIGRWHALSAEEKRTKYFDNSCHELNLFLYLKHRPFFDANIKPLLEAKTTLDAIDCCLIDRPLDQFITATAWSAANPAEKVLLAWACQRRGISGPHLEDVARQLADEAKARPETPEHIATLFDAALLSVPPSEDELMDTSPDEAVSDASMDDEDDFDGMDYEPMVMARAEAAINPERENSLFGGGGFGASRRGMAPGQPPSQRATLFGAAPPPAEMASFTLGATASRSMMRGADTAKMRKKARAKPVFSPPDQTQEFTERTYYAVTGEDLADGRLHPRVRKGLVTTAAFWGDLASHLANNELSFNGFLSKNWFIGCRTFSDVALRLAFLDINLNASAELQYDADQLSVMGRGGACLVLCRSVKPAPKEPRETILLNQSYFVKGNETKPLPNGQVQDLPVENFCVFTAYTCRAVLTNVSSAELDLDVYSQIPQGAIPLDGQPRSTTRHARLSSFSTHVIKYSFYFPKAGSFKHYPAQVSSNGKVIGAAQSANLEVAQEPPQIDVSNWPAVALNGTNDQVVEFLTGENLAALDSLHRIYWRLGQHDFFTRLVELLSKRGIFDRTVLTYGLKHKDTQSIAMLLDLVKFDCGPCVDCSLVCRPIRQCYTHTELDPIISARAHKLGRERQIVNDKLKQRFMQLLQTICFCSDVPTAAKPSLVLLLIYQDRIEEAKAIFDSIQAADLPGQTLPLDYMKAYFASFEEETLPEAKAVASQYSDHPAKRWKKMFNEVSDMVHEVETGKSVLEREGDEVSARLPALEISTEGNMIALHHENIEGAECSINLYKMDVELMFSNSPFVKDQSGNFTFVTPNATMTVALSQDSNVTKVDIPPALITKDLVVEAVAAGLRKSTTRFSNSLKCTVVESHGQLKVTDSDGKALSRTYVKVYGKYPENKVQFFKDGYTDLRGRFDYVSVNTDESQVRELAILVTSPTHGSLIRQVKAPKM